MNDCVIESDPRNEGRKVLRCLVVGTALEVALAASSILALQVFGMNPLHWCLLKINLSLFQASERYVITALVLSYPDNPSAPPDTFHDWNSTQSHGADECLQGVSLVDVGDAFIRQQLGQKEKSPPLRWTGRRYARVMRMLRLAGVEVLWESMLEDSDAENTSPDDNVSPLASDTCMKDIDGCNCGPEFYRNAEIRHSLDHVLAERDGFYDVVLNLDTGIRAPLDWGVDQEAVEGRMRGGRRVSLCSKSNDSRNRNNRMTGEACAYTFLLVIITHTHTHTHTVLTSYVFLFIVSGIAPDTAAKLKRVARQFSYLKQDLHAFEAKDPDFDVLNNSPFFVNVNIQISHSSVHCGERARSPSFNLRGGKVLLPCLEVAVGLEVMMVTRQSARQMSFKKRDHDAKENNNKFLSLIRQKQLFEHHRAGEVVTVQADTHEGFYAFTVARHRDVMEDIECLLHFLAQRSCVAAQDNLGDVRCRIDESDDGNPLIFMSTTVRDVAVSGARQPSALPADMYTRVVVNPRSVLAVACDLLSNSFVP
jgi:hypothetical protein